MLEDPPSLYVLKYLVDRGLVALTGLTWPGSSPNLPDDEPINRVVVVDTFPVLDGRDLRSGEVLMHPAVMVVIRGRPYSAAWAKGMAIQAALAEAKRETVTPAGRPSALLQSFTLTTGLARYSTSDRNKADLLSLNGTVTIKEV